MSTSGFSLEALVGKIYAYFDDMISYLPISFRVVLGAASGSLKSATDEVNDESFIFRSSFRSIIFYTTNR